MLLQGRWCFGPMSPRSVLQSFSGWCFLNFRDENLFFDKHYCLDLLKCCPDLYKKSLNSLRQKYLLDKYQAIRFSFIRSYYVYIPADTFILLIIRQLLKSLQCIFIGLWMKTKFLYKVFFCLILQTRLHLSSLLPESQERFASFCSSLSVLRFLAMESSCRPFSLFFPDSHSFALTLLMCVLSFEKKHPWRCLWARLHPYSRSD